jgi:hypothetical protein
MAACGQLSPPDDREEALSELSWRRHEVLGKDCHPGRHCESFVAAGVVLDIGKNDDPMVLVTQ